MRSARLWERLLGVERTVVDGVVLDEGDQAIVASVRPRRGATRRCGICERRCPRYDHGQGRRRWRALDLGTVQVWLEADAPRSPAPTTGWWSPRSPGPATAQATPGPSTTWRRGWPRTARSRRCSS